MAKVDRVGSGGESRRAGERTSGKTSKPTRKGQFSGGRSVSPRKGKAQSLRKKAKDKASSMKARLARKIRAGGTSKKGSRADVTVEAERSKSVKAAPTTDESSTVAGAGVVEVARTTGEDVMVEVTMPSLLDRIVTEHVDTELTSKIKEGAAKVVGFGEFIKAQGVKLSQFFDRKIYKPAMSSMPNELKHTLAGLGTGSLLGAFVGKLLVVAALASPAGPFILVAGLVGGGIFLFFGLALDISASRSEGVPAVGDPPLHIRPHDDEDK